MNRVISINLLILIFQKIILKCYGAAENQTMPELCRCLSYQALDSDCFDQIMTTNEFLEKQFRRNESAPVEKCLAFMKDEFTLRALIYVDGAITCKFMGVQGWDAELNCVYDYCKQNSSKITSRTVDECVNFFIGSRDSRLRPAIRVLPRKC